MSEIESTRATYDHYALIMHPTEQRALLVKNQSGEWGLYHPVPEKPYATRMDLVKALIGEQLGLEATLLLSIDTYFDLKEGKRVEAIYVMESHSPNWRPPGGSAWLACEQLTSLVFSMPRHKQLVEQWLADKEIMTTHICERIPVDGIRIILADGPEDGPVWADLLPIWDQGVRPSVFITN